MLVTEDGGDVGVSGAATSSLCFLEICSFSMNSWRGKSSSLSY